VEVLVSLNVQTLEFEHTDLFLLNVLHYLTHLSLAVEYLLHPHFVDAVSNTALVYLVQEGLGELMFVVVEDLFSEEVERNLGESTCVPVAHVEAVQLSEHTCEHLGDDLEVVPLGGQHGQEVFPLLVLDLFGYLGLDLLHDQFFVALEHAAVALLVFSDFHYFFLVGGHKGRRDVNLQFALQEI